LAKKTSRWRRRGLYTLGAFAVAVPALWIGIHEIPWLGPALADGVRAVFGPKPIAWAEDVTYGIQDRFDRWRYKDAAPKTFWDVPSGTPTAPPLPVASVVIPVALGSGAPVAGSAPAAAAAATFPPPAFSPPFDGVASPGDGTWIPMKDPGLAKAIVHPDPKRGFAAVAVVAMDLKRTTLHLVAGTSEPQGNVPQEHRPGLVPKAEAADLIAAFNGGFKAMHGHYGMMLDGETFVVPRDIACTVGLYKDGAIKIGTWKGLKVGEPQMQGYRQTPPCLVEDGKINSALDLEYSKNWGATVSGETVIRRSAIGIDKAGTTLFYGFGEAVTAQALAHAMRAIGAEDAAQLDVNYSYPRFLLYEAGDGAQPPRVESALIPGIKYTKGEYVTEAAPRDFFYVTRKKPAL
jgi:phosphodiester glycosidase